MTLGSDKSPFEEKGYLCIVCLRNKHYILLLIIPVQPMNGTNEVWKESPPALAKITVLVCSFVKGNIQEKEACRVVPTITVSRETLNTIWESNFVCTKNRPGFVSVCLVVNHGYCKDHPNKKKKVLGCWLFFWFGLVWFCVFCLVSCLVYVFVFSFFFFFLERIDTV